LNQVSVGFHSFVKRDLCKTLIRRSGGRQAAEVVGFILHLFIGALLIFTP